MDREQLDIFYRATTFLVYRMPEDAIAIRIGRLQSALDDVLRSKGAASWAFLTACNPRSIPLTPAENAESMKALTGDLIAEGYAFWLGLGVSDHTDWTPEESVLVFGMTKVQAEILSKRYDQNAFVFGEQGRVAELIWTL